MIHFILCILLIYDRSVNEILGWVIPFLLGLSSSFIIDKFRSSLKKREIKKFITIYLKEYMLAILPKLKTEYEKVQNYIQNYPQEKYRIPVFEGFNENILIGIPYSEYFEVFKKDFVLLNEIISMIEFLKSNLPKDMTNEYFDFINFHLKEKGKTGDWNHVKYCQKCKEKNKETISNLKFRIEETELLIGKIEELILKKP